MENVDAILSGGMHIAQSLHLWKLSSRDAIALQKRLVSRLTTKRLPSAGLTFHLICIAAR